MEADLGTILTGRNAGEFFEGTQEIGIVAEAAEIGDLAEGQGLKELLLGQDDTAVKDIVIDAVMDIAHELMGQGGDADAEGFGKAFQGQRLHIVLIDIDKDLMHHRVRRDSGKLGRGTAQGIQDDAEQGKDIGEIPETVHRSIILTVFHDGGHVVHAFIRNLAFQGIDEAALTLCALGEELDQVNLAAADSGQEIRGAIEVSPFIAGQGLLTHEAVHVERRDDDELIRLEHIDFVVYAKLAGTADMEIDLIKVMTVETVVLTIEGDTVEAFIITASMAHGTITEVGYLLGIAHVFLRQYFYSRTYYIARIA